MYIYREISKKMMIVDNQDQWINGSLCLNEPPPRKDLNSELFFFFLMVVAA